MVQGVATEAVATRKDLIVAGRAALVDLGVDSDDLVDARAEAQIRLATPENTLDVLRWAIGFLIRYCGQPSRPRRHDPPTVGTIRQMIADAFYMVKKNGDPPGRHKQPYAPMTIELLVYALSMIFDRLQWVNPIRHPLIEDQLKGYKTQYELAGYRTDESDALSNDQNAALVRSYDLGTVQGLRNAAMVRGQFDMGCRADEWCRMQAKDVRWESDERVLVTFIASTTKGSKKRTVPMQMHKPKLGLGPDVLEQTRADLRGRLVWLTAQIGAGQDTPGTVQEIQAVAGRLQDLAEAAVWHAEEATYLDIDPVRLLLAYWRARQSAGWDGTGPLWVEVNRGDRRKDFAETGTLGGRFRTEQMTYNAYAKVFDRAVLATGIDLDPVTGQKAWRFTTHANRIGFINEARRRGFVLEEIGRITGHSPNSPALARYLRETPLWDGDNPGLAIRADTRKEHRRRD